VRIWRRISLAVGIVAILCGALQAQSADHPGSTPGDSGDGNSLARAIIENELTAEAQDQSLWHYRQLREEKGRKQLREIYQTTDGEISRVLELNGVALSPKQRQQETQRIHNLARHPEALREQTRKQKEDAQKARKLLKIFPQAFLFHVERQEGPRTELIFKPNPRYHPAGREAEVFHHMAGAIWLDTQQKRLVSIHGHLMTDVKFGGGLLGHLDKGGTFLVKQKDLGEGVFEMETLNVNMNGKALFFKTIAVQQSESDSGFERLPAEISATEAVQRLEAPASEK
jgi:hypothetical protein